MSAPQECMSWDDAPATIKVEIMRILGPDIPFLDHVPVVPKTHGYLYLTFFIPLWRRGEKRFAYIGKKSDKANLTYRGSGRRPEFNAALAEIPPQQCVKVFLGVFPRGRNLERMEYVYQRRVGIPEVQWGGDIDHDVWLNRFAYSENQHMSPEQRSAAGRIGGKIGGKIGGRALAAREKIDPALRAKMQARRSAGGKAGGRTTADREKTDLVFRARRQAIRSATGKMLAEREKTDPAFKAQQRARRSATGKVCGKINGAKTGPGAARNMSRIWASLVRDPVFWERHLPHLPEAVIPRGFVSSHVKVGFDVPDEAIIVPVARPLRHKDVSLSSKMTKVLRTIYDRPSPPSFAEHKDDLRAAFPPPDSYGVPRGARAGVVRDCRKGLFSLVHEGRVILGPGVNEPRLRWEGGRWFRGRVVSAGPYNPRPTGGVPTGPLGYSPQSQWPETVTV